MPADYRYFPAVEDDEFGFVLHPVDLAVNKLMAAASRRELRDIVDLVQLSHSYLPLGAIVWAAIPVAPGFTPEGLIAELRRNSRYTAEDFRQLDVEPAIDAGALMNEYRLALEQAEGFVAAMPTDEAGTIYLKDGVPALPDPHRLDSYIRHKPKRQGHWPTDTRLTTAMLDKLKSQTS